MKSLKAINMSYILNIKEKDTLVFEFELPGYDVVFEYEGQEKDDIKKVKKLLIYYLMRI